MDARIAVDNLWKEYPSETGDTPAHAAVAGVSLVVEQGQRLGIVGRNGAGKSTLLHLIAGLGAPTRGSIEIAGKVTSVMTLGVGLRDALTGRENIYLDGEMQGRSRREVDAAMDAIVEFAELGEFIDQPVRTYSTGMKARLGFSMISHLDPQILIIDEALSVGDVAFAAKATARIREICTRGRIVIIVSHSMQAISEMCNRCLWMDDGRIVMDGTPEEVTTAYLDAVHAADDSKLAEEFRHLVGARSRRDGWIVERAVTVDSRAGEVRTRLQAGQDVRFEISAQVPVAAERASVRVRVRRLDGLAVFDERFVAADFRVRGAQIGLAVELEPLVFGTGLYRLEVVLFADEESVAENFGLFEVFAVTAPRGGRPVLLYPFAAEVTSTLATDGFP